MRRLTVGVIRGFMVCASVALILSAVPTTLPNLWQWAATYLSDTRAGPTTHAQLCGCQRRRRSAIPSNNTRGEYALNAIWGDANYFNGRSMDVYIAKLRKHLKADGRVEILNVHGKGFKLIAD